jgi:hypothetical protein
MSRARRLLTGAAATLVVAGLVMGCGGDDGGRPGTPDAGTGNVTISRIQDQTIDEDGATMPLAFTVTVGAELTASSSNKTLVPDANIVFGGAGGNRTVTVTPADDEAGSTTITITARVGSRTAMTSFMLTVRPLNDPPTISDITDKTTEEGTALAAIPFTVGDAETMPAMLTVTATSDNSTLVPPAGLVLAGTGASRTLTVTPAATQVGSATITVEVSDGTAMARDTFSVTVSRSNAVNDPPVNSVPGAQSRNEGTMLVFSAAGSNAISVDDPDAGNSPVRVTLAVTGGIGTLTLASTSGLTFQTGSGTGNTTMTFTGTIGAVNTALNGLTLTPPAGFSGTGALTITTNDQGNTGTGGPQQDADTVQITIVAVNDPPTILEIPDKEIMEDGSTGSLTFTISDTDTPISELVVTRETSNPEVIPLAGVVLGGTGANRNVTVTPATNAFGSSLITISVFDGEATATMSFLVDVTPVEDDPTVTIVPEMQTMNAGEMLVIPFTVSDPETAAASLTVTATQSPGTPALNATVGGAGAERTLTLTAPLGMNGDVTITLTVTDAAGETDTDSVLVKVNNINDPPVITVPDANDPQVVHTDNAVDGEGTLSFTSANPITITDDASASADLTLRLQATEGVTTTGALPSNTTRTAGADGSADQTLEGPLAELNEVLDGLLFTSDPGFTGDDAALEITVNDNGASGTGGPQETSATIQILVNAKPTISPVPGDRSIDEDATATIEFDVHDFEQNTAGITVTATSSNPELVPDEAIEITGNAGERTMTIEPLADQSGETTIELTIADLSGGERVVSFDLTVDPVNDAPVLTAPAEPSTTEDVALVFDGTLSIEDVDDDEHTVTLAATSGTVTLATTVGLTFTAGTGEEDTTVTFTGSTDNVNAALDGASFMPGPEHFNGDAELAVTVDDGDDTDEATLTIEVVPSNDAPVITPVDGLLRKPVNMARTIELTVADVDVTALQDLEVTIVTSDGTIDLMDRSGLDFSVDSDDMLVFTGTLADINDALAGGNGGIQLDPDDAFTGDVTVTVTVSDLGNTGPDGTKVATHSWVTTYSSGNTDPTISAINSRTIEEDDADGNTAMFVVNDAETAPGNLEVSVALTQDGSNPVEVTLTLGGSGMNRTLKVVPAPNDHGRVTIRITVFDGEDSATEEYNLTVEAVNDAPTIEPAVIPTVTIDEDGSFDLAFQASDVDGTQPIMEISSDNTDLLPNSAFTSLTRTGVRITPVADLSGTATVTLSADDEMAVTTRTFQVVVRAVNDPPVIAGTYPELSVSDKEVDDGTFEVRIDAEGGTVTLRTIAGLTFVDGDDDGEDPDGDGNQEAHMIFRGSEEDVNAALDGLTDSVTDGVIVIVVSDLGVSPATDAFPERTDTLCVAQGTGSCP